MKVEIYSKAFQLQDDNLAEESIVEFKRILEAESDSLNICYRMIAALYYYRLNDCQNALPFALEAVAHSPRDEMASLCLVHCLYEAGHPYEMENEIRRFVSAGGELNLFKAFIEESGAKVSDFS